VLRKVIGHNKMRTCSRGWDHQKELSIKGHEKKSMMGVDQKNVLPTRGHKEE